MNEPVAADQVDLQRAQGRSYAHGLDWWGHVAAYPQRADSPGQRYDNAYLSVRGLSNAKRRRCRCG